MSKESKKGEVLVLNQAYGKGVSLSAETPQKLKAIARRHFKISHSGELLVPEAGY